MKKAHYLLLCGMIAAVLLTGCGKEQTAGTEANTDDISQVEEQPGEAEPDDTVDQPEDTDGQSDSAEEEEKADNSADDNLPVEERQIKRIVKWDTTYEGEKSSVESVHEYDEQGNLTLVWGIKIMMAVLSTNMMSKED